MYIFNRRALPALLAGIAIFILILLAVQSGSRGLITLMSFAGMILPIVAFIALFFRKTRESSLAFLIGIYGATFLSLVLRNLMA